MATPITASRLRADVYRILDHVLETGTPVEISRAGKRLRIVPVDEAPDSKLSRLQPHPDAVVGDAEAIVDIDWTDAWRP